MSTYLPPLPPVVTWATGGAADLAAVSVDGSTFEEDTAMPELTGRRAGRPNLWWAVHNLFAHPVSELCFWLRIPRFGNWLHDATVPEHVAGTGRG